MAQYDVFTNPSGSAAEGIPYVVMVQSDLLDAPATRLTMPQAMLDVATRVPTVLCPVTMVKGQRAGVGPRRGVVGNPVRCVLPP